MSSKYHEFVVRGRQRYGDRFGLCNINPLFIPHFESGGRVRVDFGDGDIKDGYVGVTMGWHPTFILLSRKNSNSSSDVIGKGAIPLRG